MITSDELMEKFKKLVIDFEDLFNTDGREALFDTIKHPIHFFSMGFGSGLSPIAPGTAGSLAAIPLIFFMHALLGSIGYIIVTILAFAVGIWLCQQTNQALSGHDHSAIVWDEIVGMMVACAWVSADSGLFRTVFLGFVLFRIFDIIKPPPIRQLDRQVDGGLGIMLDDMVAGAMALATIGIIRWIW